MFRISSFFFSAAYLPAARGRFCSADDNLPLSLNFKVDMLRSKSNGAAPQSALAVSFVTSFGSGPKSGSGPQRLSLFQQ